MKPVRYSYGITASLLAGGAAISLITGQPAGAQVAQNDQRQISGVVPRAGAPASFADLTAQLQPAVVNISTRQRITVDTNPFQGTPEEQAACAPDATSLCKDAIPDTFRVLACLKENRQRIRKVCLKVLEDHGQ